MLVVLSRQQEVVLVFVSLHLLVILLCKLFEDELREDLGSMAQEGQLEESFCQVLQAELLASLHKLSRNHLQNSSLFQLVTEAGVEQRANLLRFELVH